MSERKSEVVIFAIVLLISTACASPAVPPVQSTGSSVIETGRSLTSLFYERDLTSLWRRMTPEMKDAAGGSLEKFFDFREKVEELAGSEVRVFDEAEMSGDDLVYYRRVASFEKMTEPLVVQWGLDAEGQIADFFVRPAEPATEVSYESRTELHLPFRGEWYVTAGGRTVERNQHSLDYSNRFALDLVKASEFEIEEERHRNEDFATWGAPLLAPADGVVSLVRNGIEDNQFGESSQAHDHPMGNYVSIDHGNGEFSVLGHLRNDSIRVAPGARVTRGQVVGLAGNSGNSNGPHLHFNLQDRPQPNRGRGLPAIFVDVLVDGELRARAELEQGQRVRDSTSAEGTDRVD